MTLRDSISLASRPDEILVGFLDPPKYKHERTRTELGPESPKVMDVTLVCEQD